MDRKTFLKVMAIAPLTSFIKIGELTDINEVIIKLVDLGLPTQRQDHCISSFAILNDSSDIYADYAAFFGIINDEIIQEIQDFVDDSELYNDPYPKDLLAKVKANRGGLYIYQFDWNYGLDKWNETIKLFVVNWEW